MSINADTLNCQNITASGANVFISNFLADDSSAGLNIRNATDPTKTFHFTNLANIQTIATSSTANTTYTFPDITDTIMNVGSLQSAISNKTIPSGSISLSMNPINLGNTTGGVSGCISIGVNAVASQTNCMAIGSSAKCGSSGTSNTSIGSNAGLSLTSGSNNSFLGSNAGRSNTTASFNVAVGSNALYSSSTVTDVTSIGTNSLQTQTSSTGTISIGYNTLYSGTNAAQVVAVGSNAVKSFTTAVSNPTYITAVGYNTVGSFTTSSERQTAIGYSALSSLAASNANVAIGSSALSTYVGSAVLGSNVAIGSSCLLVQNGTTSPNVGVGVSCLTSNTTGNLNTGVGFESIKANTTGTTNVGVGYRAFYATTSGNDGVVIGSSISPLQTYSGTVILVGASAGVSLTIAGAPVLVGYSVAPSMSSSTNTSAVGFNAGANITSNFRCACFGNGSSASGSGAPNNELILGNGAITSFRCQVSLTVLSDRRDKTDIIPLEETAGLAFVEDLKPVRFTWNTRDGLKKDIKDVGFLAQDLQKTQEKLNTIIPNLIYDVNPEKLQVTHYKLFPILIKSVQELNLEIDRLSDILDKYEATLATTVI